MVNFSRVGFYLPSLKEDPLAAFGLCIEIDKFVVRWSKDEGAVGVAVTEPAPFAGDPSVSGSQQ